MDTTIYSAMSAAKQLQLMSQVISSNISNANTVGYKADGVAFKSLYLNAQNGVGTVAYPELSGTHVDLSSGPVNYTDNPYDAVSAGDSYFRLRSADGENFYSKSISVHLDQNGFLKNSDGSNLIGMSGELINVSGGDFRIKENGDVVSQSNATTTVFGKLSTANLNNSNAYKSTSGRIIGAQETPPVLNVNSNVRVGYREESNVNSVSEMTDLMNVQRNYDLTTKVMSTYKSLGEYSNKLVSD